MAGSHGISIVTFAQGSMFRGREEAREIWMIRWKIHFDIAG